MHVVTADVVPCLSSHTVLISDGDYEQEAPRITWKLVLDNTSPVSSNLRKIQVKLNLTKLTLRNY